MTARRWLVVAAVVVAALVAARVVAARVDSASPALLPDPTARTPLLGVVFRRATGYLVRLNAASLRPLTKNRTVSLGSHHWSPSFSPDRSRLVLGTPATADLRFVDVSRLKLLGDVKVAHAGFVAATQWLSPGRVVAVVEPKCCGFGRSVLTFVDARTRAVTASRELDGAFLKAVSTKRGLVVLLAPPDGIGPATLALVRADGSVALASLERLAAGTSLPPDETAESVAHRTEPGLAADPAGTRAFVVPPDGSVAEVDLSTLAVSWHDPAPSRSALARFARWLEPSAQAKAFSGGTREAAWVGRDVVAVSGLDYTATPTAAGVIDARSSPAGLRLIDTRAWTTETISRSATSFALANRELLATGSWSSSDDSYPVGMGVAAYNASGVRRFHVLSGQAVLLLGVYRGRAYAQTFQDVTRVVDVRAGRLVGERTAELPMLLVEPAAPVE
jgi:hypothetical protein